ncbi:5-guanidino-2-oxopentanoate decarboxylase [Paracoccus sp. Z330]|uniref:5-guanidino-2-oxopentanoate decarboxylase n=1 Tax=Paracoccus onchidii TaxID=3017813 RepID=A0ABT4ZFX9_9RHOB|nr:5-guanidino-2-oxopentanoate decarboxylase [Paracoccus onchidii]MDB6178285.1 5-guanidino-2-oxopentanoate decarboxylase [Paracoccus onchidii]
MTNSPLRAGPWIHRLLTAYDVDTVFGIPGVHTIPLYDGLSESGLRHITPRHEQGAGFMADGYARISGKPGVCFVITGPGVTNIITPMAQAYAESVPMLVISSVNNRRHMGFGQGQLHELPDQQAIMREVSAFSHTLQSLADLPKVLSRAFAVFNSGRPRPVHIEIPLDLWQETPPQIAVPLRQTSARPSPAGTDIAAAAGALAAAERPVILCGGGAASASDAVRRLAETLDAPVIMTTNARGIMGAGHPLAVPFSPSLAEPRALLADSDAAIAIGTEIGPTDFDMYETGMPELPHPLIRIEIDPVQMVTNAVPDIALLGDAGHAISELTTALAARVRDGAARAKECRDAAFAALDARMRAGLRFLEILHEVAPDMPIIGDSTHPVYAGNLGHDTPAAKLWHNSATGFGTLGYALPAAVGASLARDGSALCLVGDGGLHYSIGELAALAGAQAPVIVLIWNNECYGEIRDAMVADNIAPVGVALASPDFRALAQAYGIDACRVSNETGLRQVLQNAIATARPVVIEIDEAAMLVALGTD